MNGSKVAVVTGGTFGIGRDITLGLAEKGHSVVAFGLEAAQVSSTAEGSVSSLRSEVERRGLSVEVLDADVTDAAAVAGVVDHTLTHHGRIDALVNNAAVGPLGTVLDTDEELFERILSVNLKGPYLTSRAVLPHLLEGGGGSIVNIGSGAGWGKPNMAAYAASKGGLFALSAATAYDFFHDRVRVNTVVPGGGGIVSGISLGRMGANAASFGKGAAGSAAGRPVNGNDIANVVAFLISDAAEAISGTVVDVGCFSHQGGPVNRKKES
ncbi:SDR family NAD(P)-dependent oxidoreductase [Sinomonas atrocyanea]|uniref:SDR family NAD(P)-dependent oxidoreductase n=1 Tax=Sinomonas atrocyanea TaxID=37927 RepID=UPI002789A614|nr:SDR family oxidoreductase [Sinomonas atrocyanea]MDQ0260846.1 NAD(P)-dependent dehydrogenase (short-subunit alcohol dehydrogenase family) [Sinomonas atrocyanea]MDR6621578.1 NAD(P)-dependent dehydrogenase (short-subunit alcohol dehydrogenase family) [Sinomonas atrocyanea]